MDVNCMVFAIYRRYILILVLGVIPEVYLVREKEEIHL